MMAYCPLAVYCKLKFNLTRLAEGEVGLGGNNVTNFGANLAKPDPGGFMNTCKT